MKKKCYKKSLRFYGIIIITIISIIIISFFQKSLNIFSHYVCKYEQFEKPKL